MNKKLITATSKTDTHLIFDIKVSIPLEEVSDELANDVLEMFDKPFHLDIPVERHIDFFTDIDGKEKFSVSVVPKNMDTTNNILTIECRDNPHMPWNRVGVLENASFEDAKEFVERVVKNNPSTTPSYEYRILEQLS